MNTLKLGENAIRSLMEAVEKMKGMVRSVSYKAERLVPPVARVQPVLLRDLKFCTKEVLVE